MLLSEKYMFLEFFYGLLPENGDGEQKSNFWNFIYIFKPLFWLFNFVAPLCRLEDMIFIIKKITQKIYNFFQGGLGTKVLLLKIW